MNLTEVTDLTSIGTLFAFVLVCGGVLLLPKRENRVEGGFRLPYVNGKIIVPVLLTAAALYFREPVINLFDYSGGWHVFKHNIPYLLFIVFAAAIAFLSFLKNLSLIPVVGLLSCLYLMSELGYTNWMRFLIWLAIGLIIYFSYSRRNSRLNENSKPGDQKRI